MANTHEAAAHVGIRRDVCLNESDIVGASPSLAAFLVFLGLDSAKPCSHGIEPHTLRHRFSQPPIPGEELFPWPQP
jgi:hypothetical protein